MHDSYLSILQIQTCLWRKKELSWINNNNHVYFGSWISHLLHNLETEFHFERECLNTKGSWGYNVAALWRFIEFRFEIGWFEVLGPLRQIWGEGGEFEIGITVCIWMRFSITINPWTFFVVTRSLQVVCLRRLGPSAAKGVWLQIIVSPQSRRPWVQQTST